MSLCLLVFGRLEDRRRLSSVPAELIIISARSARIQKLSPRDLRSRSELLIISDDHGVYTTGSARFVF